MKERYVLSVKFKDSLGKIKTKLYKKSVDRKKLFDFAIQEKNCLESLNSDYKITIKLNGVFDVVMSSKSW